MEHFEKNRKNYPLPIIGKVKNKMISLGMKRDLPSKEIIYANKKSESALNKNINSINSVINKESMILVTNTIGEINYLNDKCSATLGYQSNELVGKHTRIFNTGIHSKEFYRELWMKLLSGETWKGEITAKRKDGSVGWYFMSIFPLWDDNHQLHQFLTVRTDITDLKEMERQVLTKEKQLQSFFGILTNAVVGCIDQNGMIMYLSPAVESIKGFKVSERLGFSIFDNIAPNIIPSFRKSIEEIKKVPGCSMSIEIIFRSKTGTLLSCEFTAKNLLHDPNLKTIIFAYRDITEQKRTDQELKHLVNYDLLTGLPNYSNFEESLKREIDYSNENNTNFAIMQLGLDDFKYVNSTFGHSTGDLLLKEFSNRIKYALPDNISMYRMSGDLFIFLMKEIKDVEEMPETLGNLVSLITKEPINIDGNKMYISVSMGVSVFPYSGENKEELLKNAEIAMYRAKNNGKNQFQIFSPTMNLYSYKQFMLRNDSKKALLNNEFLIYYQPRIDPVTNEMISAEALIRWNHPKWGMVIPDEFISNAESSGLIVQIGEWVIRKVCSDLKKWERERLPIKKMSINISSIQLLQPNFLDMVSSILKELGVSPYWIEFEITETVIIKNEDEVFNTLTQLKNLGITIALDDFGTGYSSLNYLRIFPCDVIKIDKNLIREIHSDNGDYEIISSTIALCHKLNKSVVAEGVETKEQLVILRKLQCDEVQGYLYSKPVGKNEFRKFLKEGIGIKIEESAIIPENNRRKYFRIPLEVPLVANMTIEKFGNKVIKLGTTIVLIQNIGPGGLCFCSTLRLPINKEMVLLFITEIFSEELIIKGHIVWNKQMENSYEYGVEFTFTNEVEQQELTKILNNLHLKLRQNPVISGCRFYLN